MNILLAPIQSLFNFNFYRQAGHTPLSRCFLYLLYLSALVTTLIFIVFLLRVSPLLDDAVAWVKQDMPTITWTPEGISIDKPSPYPMTHPEYGPLITFDTSKTEVTAEEMGGILVFITSKKVFVADQGGQLRTYDLTQASGERAAQAPSSAAIDAEAVQRFYNLLKPWLYALVLVVFFFVFFVWKLLAALFYSWVGLILNFFSKPRLPYDTIFKISVFAITPWFIFQLASGLVPFLGRLAGNFFLALIVTSIYLFLAFKNAKQDPAFAES